MIWTLYYLKFNCIQLMNPSHQIKSKKYSIIQQIGEGGSATIFSILHKESQTQMAAKIIRADKSKDQLKNIEKQIEILSKCGHQNIVRCFGVELFNNEVWILMQLCKEGSLSDIMKKRKQTYTEAEIAQIMKNVLNGLSYLHQNGIIHRDIKASNILKSGNSFKISDFGVSQYKTQQIDDKNSKIGSPFWMSPQLLAGSQISQKVDIWSIGITAIELAEGEPPYSHQHPYRAIFSIQSHPPRGLKNPEHFSKEFNQFVQACLELNQKQRPSAKQLLTHPFLQLSQNNKNQDQISNSSDDTLILHQQIPSSFWQKSDGKENQFQHINSHPNQFKHNNSNFNKKDQLIKDLYRQMEEQIQSVRIKYIQKIKAAYQNVNKQALNRQIFK